MKRLFLSAVLAGAIAAVLSGCSTTDIATYVTPGKEDESVSLTGTSKEEGTMTFEHYYLLSIDDRFYSPPGFTAPSKATVRVDPGAHKIVVGIMFRKGFGTNTHSAIVPIDASLSRGTDYVINGKIDGSKVHAWIEEVGAGKRVSNIGSGSWQVAPQGAPVPVFIPIR